MGLMYRPRNRVHVAQLGHSSWLFLLLALVYHVQPAVAQELTPRAYWPAPVGTDVLVLGYQRNTGDIVVDPSLPITGVSSEIDYFQVSYQRAFSLYGRTATVQLSQPYSEGMTEGFVGDEYRERTTTGLVDTRLRFAVNLIGAPAMDAAGFRALRQNPRTIVGASVVVQAPTGSYEDDKVINIGTNRWAIKPALGMIVPLRRTWLFEAEIGAWFFADNDNFLGETREQDPILALELHLVKRVRPGFWLSLDANYYTGGETHIGSDIQDNLQRNSRAGLTIAVPLKRGIALRGSYSSGVATRSGGDFDLFSLGLMYIW